MTQKVSKHIGFTNTGSKCAVIMARIPDREDHALIVETDVLPPKYSDSFGDLLKTEAQNTNESLANLLNRRRFPTSHRTMLEELHLNNYLKAVPVEKITMMVTGTQTMPLKDIVDAMEGVEKPEVAEQPVENQEPEVQAMSDLSQEDQAKNLLMQSKLLEDDANKLKEQAYLLDPTLKPKKRGRKKKVE